MMTAQQHDEIQGCLNLVRMLIITTLQDSYSPCPSIRKGAYDFVKSEFCELICEAIKLHHDDLCDMMGNREQISSAIQAMNRIRHRNNKDTDTDENDEELD